MKRTRTRSAGGEAGGSGAGVKKSVSTPLGMTVGSMSGNILCTLRADDSLNETTTSACRRLRETARRTSVSW